MAVERAKNLVLITARFPYGIASETFLENEFPILAEDFEQIYILPRAKDGDVGCRELPENVIVSDVLVDTWKREEWNHSIVSICKAWFVFLYCLLLERDSIYLKQRAFFVPKIIQELTIEGILKDFIKERGLSKPIVYTYWMYGWNLAVARLRIKGLISKAVTRCHGFDTYDERWNLGVVPFRRYVAKYFDKIYPACDAGSLYLKKKIPKAWHYKVQTSHLGVMAQVNYQPDKIDVPVLVSCSSIIPLKRVEKIVEVLQYINTPLHWVHFGDGEGMDNLKSVAAALPSNVSHELKGAVPNSTIIDYYKENSVDCFLSLTSTEGGVPVSMMESISFGVPVVACAVGGVPELVTNETGVLLNPEENIKEWAVQLKMVLDGEVIFDTEKIRKFYMNRFNAEKNYHIFCNELRS